MRCTLAVLFAFALLLALPVSADAPADIPSVYRLIWKGQYAEAEQYLTPLIDARPQDALPALCFNYSLQHKNQEALDTCMRAMALPLYRPAADCVVAKATGRANEARCSFVFGYEALAEMLALQALGYWRTHDLDKAARALHLARTAKQPPSWFNRLIAIAIDTPPQDQRRALVALREEVPDKPEQRARFQTARASFLPGVPDTPPWTLGGILLVLFGLAALAGMVYQRQRLLPLVHGAAAWLRQHAPTPAAAASPAHPADPAIPPYAYYDYRYLNRAYEYAAYAHAAFWLLLIIPLLLLTATPLVTILADFSARGMESAVLNARGVAATLLAWSRVWLALLILTLTAVVGLKVYGRYTLPKRFRPRIHVIRLTFRLTVLSIVLLSAATFFVFAANPVVQLLIDILRKSFGL